MGPLIDRAELASYPKLLAVDLANGPIFGIPCH
jgi:hypothetical protein